MCSCCVAEAIVIEAAPARDIAAEDADGDVETVAVAVEVFQQEKMQLKQFQHKNVRAIQPKFRSCLEEGQRGTPLDQGNQVFWPFRAMFAVMYWKAMLHILLHMLWSLLLHLLHLLASSFSVFPSILLLLLMHRQREPNSKHAHPPTPENTLLGVGRLCKRGGSCKNPAAGGFKIYPPPLSKKCLLSKIGGGGAYVISPPKHTTIKPWHGKGVAFNNSV